MDIMGKWGKLWLVFGISFLDFLAYAAVIPLVPLILLQTPQSILPTEFSVPLRYILLGSLLATYPLAQIIAEPLLGFFSDAISRKRVFQISFLGNTLGYLLFALGIYFSNLGLLFLGNFVAGVTGGNLATTNALIADLSPPVKKVRLYSLSHMIIGLAFVLGPYLSSKIFFSCFPAFLGCAAISFINFLLIHLFFDSSEQKRVEPISFKEIRESFRELIQEKVELRPLFLSTFLLFCGWYFFIKFFQVLLIHQIRFSEEAFCHLLSYFGLCCVLTQLFFSLVLHKIARPQTFVYWFGAVLCGSLFSFIFIETYWATLVSVTLFSVAYSILCPSLIALISDAGSKENQGKILGFYYAMQSLAKVLAPCLAGTTMLLFPAAPILCSCLFIVASGLAFTKISKRAQAS